MITEKGYMTTMRYLEEAKKNIMSAAYTRGVVSTKMFKKAIKLCETIEKYQKEVRDDYNKQNTNEGPS